MYQEDESGNLGEFDKSNPLPGKIFGLAEVDKVGRVDDSKFNKPSSEDEVKLVKVDARNTIRDLSPIVEAPRGSALNKLSTRLSTMPR